LDYEGKLYPEEYKRKFMVKYITTRIETNGTDCRKLAIKNHEKPVGYWLKEQFDKPRQAMHHPLQQ